MAVNSLLFKIKGMDVVDKIAKAPRDRSNDKPLEDIKIINIVEEEN